MNISSINESRLPQLRELVARMNDDDRDMSHFFEMIPGLCAIANRTHFIRLSSRWRTVLGMPREDIMAFPFLSLVHPDDVDKTIDTLSHMQGHDIIKFRNRYRHKDGHYVTLEWSASRWAEDEKTYCLATVVEE